MYWPNTDYILTEACTPRQHQVWYIALPCLWLVIHVATLCYSRLAVRYITSRLCGSKSRRAERGRHSFSNHRQHSDTPLVRQVVHQPTHACKFTLKQNHQSGKPNICGWMRRNQHPWMNAEKPTCVEKPTSVDECGETSICGRGTEDICGKRACVT